MGDRVVSANDEWLEAGSVIPLGAGSQPGTPIDDSSGAFLRLRPEWQRWLSQREFVLFATLTYGRQFPRSVAERDLRHFYDRLSDKVCGKKTVGALSFVAFLEFTKAGTPHWHLLFERVAPKAAESVQETLGRLEYLVRRVWLKMRNTPFSEAGIDIQPIYDQSALLDYCMKTSASNPGCTFITVEHLADPHLLNPPASGQ